jgi:NAD(P)-dependent dehydrogenase (short-subunit alcohol dehydrogenase family)
MVDLKDKVALIVGAGSGLSASIARVFANAGMRIALAARSIDDLAGLAAETGAKTFACDATDASAVKRLFADVAGAAALGDPYAVVYNASYRTRGPLVDPRRSRNRSPYLPLAASWSRRKRRAACCPKARARSYSPAHPQA